MRILNDSNSSKNIKAYNYSIEFTPAESKTGGTFLYINNKLSHKLRQDLRIYKSNETAQKMKFSIKDLVTFTVEIPNGKLPFLCSVSQSVHLLK